MRVSTLYIIGLCDTKTDEVLKSCQALFERYKARTDHKPSKVVLTLLNGDSEAYKAGKQLGKQAQLVEARLKDKCEVWTNDSVLVTNDSSASGMDGKSEVSSSSSIKGRVGVYFVAHGQPGLMYSNTKPAAAANVIVWAVDQDAACIDKLVLLACNIGRVEPVNQSPNCGWKGFIVSLCQVLAGNASKELLQNYSYKDKVTCTPKVAGWDDIVSVYFDGATPGFKPADASDGSVGRKVLDGGAWAADGRTTKKHAFQVVKSGSLQKLDASGWSDKV